MAAVNPTPHATPVKPNQAPRSLVGITEVNDRPYLGNRWSHHGQRHGERQVGGRDDRPLGLVEQVIDEIVANAEPGSSGDGPAEAAAEKTL